VFSEGTGNLVFDEMDVFNKRGSPNTGFLPTAGFVRNVIPVVDDVLVFGPTSRLLRFEVFTSVAMNIALLSAT
jgi:hypothetical protein